MPTYRVCVAVAVALVAVAARADVWRWTDDKGQVQYSDRWQPGAELIKTDHPHPSTDGGDTPRKASVPDRASAQLSQEAAQRAVKKDEAAARTEQCKQAKDRYDKLIISRRVYREGKNGEREYLSEDEAEQQRLQARLDMQQVCGADSK
jgi:hypothetical protein